VGASRPVCVYMCMNMCKCVYKYIRIRVCVCIYVHDLGVSILELWRSRPWWVYVCTNVSIHLVYIYFVY